MALCVMGENLRRTDEMGVRDNGGLPAKQKSIRRRKRQRMHSVVLLRLHCNFMRPCRQSSSRPLCHALEVLRHPPLVIAVVVDGRFPQMTGMTTTTNDRET